MENDNEKIKRKLSPKARFASLILALSCLIYAIQNRDLSIFITNSGIVVGIIYSIFLLLALFFFKKTKNIKVTQKLLTAFFLVFLLGPIYYSAGVVVKDIFVYIQSPETTRNWATCVTVFSILTVSLVLFYLRLKYRCIYGLSEATIGVLIAIHKVLFSESKDLIDSEFYVAILTASIFLIVRGFDNIHIGLTKEPDAVALKFLSLFEK